MTLLFKEVPDCFVITRQKGVFKQRKIFERTGRLYAEHGGGFIALRHNYSTSVPTVLWDFILFPDVRGWRVGSLGELRIADEEAHDGR